jgi:restriction endonuclease S subunit/superfamily II DNA or RNA helicase
VIEAKAEKFPPTLGLEQAKKYGQRLHVPVVFSTNGHRFVEFDQMSGITSNPKSISEFPKQETLRSRYEKWVGFKLDSPAAQPLLTPYVTGDSTVRYYQDAAIRAVLEKIARCEVEGTAKRALLSLATGAGKTRIAVHLLKRIADTGQRVKALFVCDRVELREQASRAFKNVFGANAAVVESENNQKNAQVLIATYQTLGVADDDDASFLIQNYPKNYFSHIIIDECHRSAWGKWSIILKRNPAAVQIGLTATPRLIEVTQKTAEVTADERITANNIRYFGEPVYEYDMLQGVEDGYLAACEIREGRITIDFTQLTIKDILASNPVNFNTGLAVEEKVIRRLMKKGNLKTSFMLPNFEKRRCEDLFHYLLETGGAEQKTIIFCNSDRHADLVTAKMKNLYAEWCEQNEHKHCDSYAFKCTDKGGGQEKLPDFRGSSRSYFIATTVDLLATGVDLPVVRNSQNVHINCFEESGLAFISKEQDEEMEASRVVPGDVLLNITGASIGRVCVVPSKLCPANVNQHVTIIRSDGSWNPFFLAYFISTPDFQKFILDNQSGATRQALTKSIIENFKIPLPPLHEQKRIAAILNKQMEEVEKARQNVIVQLKAAKELPTAYLRDIFNSPEAQQWDRKRLKEVCDKITDGTHQSPRFTTEGIPFLFVKNIVSGRIDFKVNQYVSLKTYEELTRRCKPIKGDVLFSAVGSFGIAVVIETDKPFIFQRHIALIKPKREQVDAHFLTLYLNSPNGRQQSELTALGVAQRTVTLKSLSNFEIFLPPYTIQKHIAEMLTEKLTEAERLCKTLEKQLEAIKKLPASLLRQAFNGEL